MKPYFLDPLKFSAAEIVRQCKRGDTSRVRELERLVHGGISPIDVGTTMEELFAFAHDQAVIDARRTVDACRQDSAGPPSVLCLIECMEAYALRAADDLYTSPGVIRRFAFNEAEELLCSCRNERDLTTNARYLEFFLDPHRYCEEIDPPALGMKEKDHLLLRAAAVTRAMSCLEAIRNGAKQRAMDALQREVTRHALTNRERCMTEEESARLLR